MKTTSVVLCVGTSKVRKAFELAHAERLLRMPNNGGWTLPPESQYEFDRKTGIRLKRKEVDKSTKD